LQVLPDHVLPFQVPPDQELPAASAVAIAPEANGFPKMSTSPCRTTPFELVRWSVPRAPSSVPAPVPAVKLCVAAIGVFVSIPSRSNSPAPCACVSAPPIFFALSIRNFFTASGVSVGYFCRINATAPEVIAAACEVPEPRKKRSPSCPSGWVASMNEFATRNPCRCDPDATRSGFLHKEPQPAELAD